MEHQAKRKKVGGRPGEIQHRMPVLLILVAAMSVVMLGLATAAIASGAPRVDVPQPPMVLPGPAASSTGGSPATADWILGAPAGERTAGIANRFGAHSVGGDRTGIYRIGTGRANALARKLGSTVGLDFAEPDVKAEATGYPSDLLYAQQDWLNQIVSTTDVTPPAVTAGSPTLGLIEEAIDANHPDLRQANLSNAT